MRLYSGADYLEHIQGVYHQHTFPEEWQSDRIPFTLDVGSNGEAEYEIHYVDIEDLETPQTVNANTSEEVQVGRGFDIEMHFNPDFSYLVDEVILDYYNKDGNFIDTDTLTGITQYMVEDYSLNKYYRYIECRVTFKL